MLKNDKDFHQNLALEAQEGPGEAQEGPGEAPGEARGGPRTHPGRQSDHAEALTETWLEEGPTCQGVGGRKY